MPTISCPKSIKACALRVTRQDACDRAVDPLTPNSRMASAGFMELNLSPDMEGGTDITTKNGCGDICIRDKDQDRLKGFDLELKLCGIPLALLEMLVGTTMLLDALGNAKGGVLRESKDSPNPDSKMLEFWSRNKAAKCSAESDNLYLQWLLMRTTNWELSGGLNFGDSALEVTLSGYAENNPNWVPSYPAAEFPTWVPGNGAAGGVPSGPPGPILPFGQPADAWTLEHQEAIQLGGPLAWLEVGALPANMSDCDYSPSSQFASV